MTSTAPRYGETLNHPWDPDACGAWMTRWEREFARRWRAGGRGGLFPVQGPRPVRRALSPLESTRVLLELELEINGRRLSAEGENSGT